MTARLVRRFLLRGLPIVAFVSVINICAVEPADAQTTHPVTCDLALNFDKPGLKAAGLADRDDCQPVGLGNVQAAAVQPTGLVEPPPPCGRVIVGHFYRRPPSTAPPVAVAITFV